MRVATCGACSLTGTSCGRSSSTGLGSSGIDLLFVLAFRRGDDVGQLRLDLFDGLGNFRRLYRRNVDRLDHLLGFAEFGETLERDALLDDDLIITGAGFQGCAAAKAHQRQKQRRVQSDRENYGDEAKHLYQSRVSYGAALGDGCDKSETR